MKRKWLNAWDFEKSGMDSVIQFYHTHPINEDQILQTLQEKGINLDNLTEETLKDYDQDHYGGVEAVDILAQKAGIHSSSYVLDVCSGMGGPARYLAHRYGCRVVGLDLTESRYQGAIRLTKLVKLDHLVEFRLGNALEMPFPEDTFHVVIGQEAWFHVPNKPKLIQECARVLKKGGTIAFTDILQVSSRYESELEKLQQQMPFPYLETLEGYAQLLEKNKFLILEKENLSQLWTNLLQNRLEMYRNLKDKTIQKFGEEHYRKWDETYNLFVSLFKEGKLGGGRFIAKKI